MKRTTLLASVEDIYEILFTLDVSELSWQLSCYCFTHLETQFPFLGVADHVDYFGNLFLSGVLLSIRQAVPLCAPMQPTSTYFFPVMAELKGPTQWSKVSWLFVLQCRYAGGSVLCCLHVWNLLPVSGPHKSGYIYLLPHVITASTIHSTATTCPGHFGLIRCTFLKKIGAYRKHHSRVKQTKFGPRRWGGDIWKTCGYFWTWTCQGHFGVMVHCKQNRAWVKKYSL